MDRIALQILEDGWEQDGRPMRRAVVAVGPVITPIFDCFEARFSLSLRYGRPSRRRGLFSTQRFNKSPKVPTPPEPDRSVTTVRDRRHRAPGLHAERPFRPCQPARTALRTQPR